MSANPSWSSPWVTQDQPASLLENEECVACGRIVYIASKRLTDGVLCSGCGQSQAKCFCPDSRVAA